MITTNYPPDFERLWTVYPKKDAKKAAYTAYLKKKVVPEDVDELIPIVIAHAKAWEKEGRERKYIPSLGPWLNGELWDNEVCTVDKHLQCHFRGCLKEGKHCEGWSKFCDEHRTKKAVYSGVNNG